MPEELMENKEAQTVIIYRGAYAFFILLVVYMLVQGDVENATINMGIALIFDPFNPKVEWHNRPLYQRVWLLVHLTITVAGFFYLVFR